MTLTWEDSTPHSIDFELAGCPTETATLTMAAHTNPICERHKRICGSTGEAVFSVESNTITIYDFRIGTWKTCRLPGATGGLVMVGRISTL